MAASTQELNILVIDDDSNAVELLNDKLDDLNVSRVITVHQNGMGALGYLHKRMAEHPGDSNALPDLIILDVYFPGGENGLEILKEIKMEPALRSIPVLVMTVSEKPKDVLWAYRNGGTVFISKFDKSGILGEALAQMRIFGMLRNKLAG